MHPKFPFAFPPLCALALLLPASMPVRAAGDLSAMPANLGGGLRELAAWHAAQVRALPPERRAAAVQERVQRPGQRVQSDAAGRVVVDVYLDGAATEAGIRAALTMLGAQPFASLPAGSSRTVAAHGVISAFLPLEQAGAAAKVRGVQSVMLVHRPWRRVGVKTSQGLPPMKVPAAQRRKFRGAGITVGVVSDSYDLTFPAAVTNVVRDDLPGTGNRAKHTIPVNVIEDGDPADSFNVDEGRAMLQIIHDVAPEAALAFCTAGLTQAAFADGIRRLRTLGNCDVIVDDIGFPDEPMFSDGIVAQAVEDVVTSTVLAGKKAIYYSAAGNGGDLGYEADFAQVSDSDARNGMAGANNLKLAQVPPELTAGGFHNFTPGAGATIVQKLVVSDAVAEISFQWDDLFDAAAITSDYNVLIFDEAGNYLATDAAGNPVSGVDDNAATGQALEIVDLEPNGDGTDRIYQLAIGRRNAGAGAARHFRYFVDTDGNLGGTFLSMNVPTIFGHSGARSGDGVGAFPYNKLARPEDFSSFGPVTIYFDDQGQRLAIPEVRQQPTLSGPDGGATAMGFFNPFFGTSAAAPHVAGAAALLLQAAGGPGSLSATQVRAAFQATALAHDLEPLRATAQSATANGTVTLSGYGDASRVSSESPDFFTVEFTGPAGAELKSVLIDLTAAGLKFDTSSDRGFPFTVGTVAGGAAAPVAGVVQPGLRKLLVTFGTFPPGGKVTFGIDRDVARFSAGGNSGDELAKATVTASILPAGATKPVAQKAIFTNATGAGYTPAAGFGFVNVDAALKSIGK